MEKTAIITGITGQDGAYLSKFLLGKEYKVIGLVRSYNNSEISKLKHLDIEKKVTLEECDLTDISQIIRVIKKYTPDEIYNLAAQSSVSLSFENPIGTFHFNSISVLNLLESIRIFNTKTKFYQASSSEMFGKISALPVTEETTFNPLSLYAVSKASAHYIAKNYRDAFNIHVCCGILFNHESFLRSPNFFIKKILHESLRIKYNLQGVLKVGNINIKRDFGFAPKYVEAMWLMLQHEKPDDYIICSGKSLKLKEIIEYVFEKLKIDSSKIIIDNDLYRPTDIIDIYGSNLKAKNILKWNYDLDFFNVLDLIIEEEELSFSANLQ
jgi:GDPmannose 4,6-dehydratase